MKIILRSLPWLRLVLLMVALIILPVTASFLVNGPIGKCSTFSFSQNTLGVSMIGSKGSLRQTATSFSMSTTSVAVESSSLSESFSQRMRKLVIPKKKSSRSQIGKDYIGRKANARPSNLQMIHSLSEFKDAVVHERETLVVVRFYATWCKACKAIGPSFYRLANSNPRIKFIDVPVTEKNVDLHQGLEVPSLPYGHVYLPGGELVEEMKISKKYFAKFEKVVQSHVDSCCFLPDGESLSPYRE